MEKSVWNQPRVCVCHQTGGRSLSLSITINIRFLLEDALAFLALRGLNDVWLPNWENELTIYSEGEKVGPEVNRFEAESRILS